MLNGCTRTDGAGGRGRGCGRCRRMWRRRRRRRRRWKRAPGRHRTQPIARGSTCRPPRRRLLRGAAYRDGSVQQRHALPRSAGLGGVGEVLAALVVERLLPLVQRAAGHRSDAGDEHDGRLLQSDEDHGPDAVGDDGRPLPFHVPDLAVGGAVAGRRGSRLRRHLLADLGDTAAAKRSSPTRSPRAWATRRRVRP